MPNVYDDDISSALEDIEEAGEACTWRQFPVPTGGTAAAPEYDVGDVPADYPVFIAFFPNTLTSLASFISVMTGTDIPTGGMRGIMGAYAFTPRKEDTIIRSSGEEVRLMADNGIDVLAPNGTPILYKLKFQR